MYGTEAYVLIALIAIVGLGLLAIVISSIRRKGKLGINLDAVNCPKLR